MGLGKSLTIVSLIASTIESSQKFEIKPLECLSPTSSHSSSAPAIDPNHFSGAIFGMPTAVAPLSEKAKADEVALERHARMSRIKVKTRGTLIVCPLTTVSNWEDQLLEHWAGPVTVFTAGAGANEKGTKKNGRAEVKRKKSGKGGGGCKKGKKRRGDSSDSDSEDEPELKELRVYVYHGNYRNPDPDYLADFDVVITTFSTLATEFSKQIRTGEEGARGESTKGKGGKKKTKKQLQEEAERDEEEYEGEDESDEVMEVDENGRSEKEKAAEEDAKAAKKRKRAANKGGAVTNLAVANENEATSPLQQIEWFRVVLDEAQ
jgi:SWI/SNF-related matrix-associated actin-dependent regulator of chromatin subfamily A3